jgi:hypothetical protein
MRLKVIVVAQLLGLILLLINGPLAEADIKPGVRAGAYFDVESGFIGGEILAGFSEQWFFNPNVEYVFVDRASLWTLNFDFHYDLITDTPFYFWLGAGPAVILFDPDAERFESDTDFAVNFFGGIGFPLPDSRIIPYVQPKLILSEDSEFSLAFGVRF